MITPQGVILSGSSKRNLTLDQLGPKLFVHFALLIRMLSRFRASFEDIRKPLLENA